MAWLQLELNVDAQHLDAVETLLFEAGAVSITVRDADESAVDDVDKLRTGVFEPAPGELKIWGENILQALLPLETNIAPLRDSLASPGLPSVMAQSLQISFVGDSDWENMWRNHAIDQVFGERLHLRPKPEGGARPSDTSANTLYLDPGLAFGSGSHPTTRLCLEWLACHVTAHSRVLDFGCGSGVLAIGAALLGARTMGVDYDPQAVLATRENAEYNGVEESVEALSLKEWHVAETGLKAQFDIVVANILAKPLGELAQTFQHVLKPGGTLVMSGVLEEQAEEVMQHYPAIAFTQPNLEEGWALLVGEKGRPEREVQGEGEGETA